MKTIPYLSLKFILVFLVVSTFCNVVEAQNSLLWKIEGNGLENPSYLYGTMHSQDKCVHDLGKLALPYIHQSEAVALELVIDSNNMFRMIMILFGQMMMKDTTLQQLYEAEDYQLVKEFVSAKMGAFAMLLKIDEIKPLFTSLLMEEIATVDSKVGKEMEMALDQYFQVVGEQADKKLIGVETFEEQMSAINRIPLQEQANMLLESVKLQSEGNESGTEMQTLMKYYLAQDLDGLMEWYEKGQKQAELESESSFDAVILLERNYRMAHRMDKIVQNQTTFIAVGALHLPGEDGLIELLSQKGYELSPVIMKMPETEKMDEKKPTDLLELEKKE